MLDDLLIRLRALFHRKSVEHDLDAEVGFHFDQQVAKYIASGMPRDEAMRRARLEFGGLDQVKEECRDARGVHFLETLAQDIRYGLRTLRKSPGFTIVAVLTLTLGIGANTAIFSVLDAVVLRPLPFASPNRLVHLTGKFVLGDQAGISPPDYVDYRAANHTFDQMAVINYETSISNLSGEGKPEQVRTSFASWNLFDALSIPPLLGRNFVPADEQVPQSQVVLLSKGIWQGHFGADPLIVGKTITLDNRSFTVAGVLSSDPSILSSAQIWLPLPLLDKTMTGRMAHFLVGVGKLKANITLDQAQTDLDADAQVIDARFPDTNKGWGLKVRSLASVLIGPVQSQLFLISGAVGLLLLIACANVANLLLSRSEARQRELAVRQALGASRPRIAQQLLTESILLACGGGLLGLLAATWGVLALRAVAPGDLPRLNEIHINAAVLLFTVGISILTAILFGLAPALRSSQAHFLEALKQAGRGMQRNRRALASPLVVGQIALSLGLLIAGGLLVESFWRLIHVNPGFQPQNLLTAKLNLPSQTYDTPSKRSAFMQDFEERARALSGVEAVGGITQLPLTREMGDKSFRLGGHVYDPSQFDDAQFRHATPGYISAMHIPLLAGRWISWTDTAEAPAVIVVDDAFARHYFPRENPIGKRLAFRASGAGSVFTQMATIVGVIGNVNHDGLDEPQRPEMYVPLAQQGFAELDIVVRTTMNPGSTGVALQALLTSLDKNQALSSVRTMQDVVASSISQPKFSALLVGIFAVLALGLASVGLYGVIAYAVSQHTNEIGIRMALGATPRDILSMVLSSGMKLAFAGCAIGILLALALGRFLQSLLFEIRATDFATLLSVSILLLIVAAAACYIPARRAMRVDPVVALRHE